MDRRVAHHRQIAEVPTTHWPVAAHVVVAVAVSHPQVGAVAPLMLTMVAKGLAASCQPMENLKPLANQAVANQAVVRVDHEILAAAPAVVRAHHVEILAAAPAVVPRRMQHVEQVAEAQCDQESLNFFRCL